MRKKTTAPILRGNTNVKRFAHHGMRYSRTRFTKNNQPRTQHQGTESKGGKIGARLSVSRRALSRNAIRSGNRAKKQTKIYIGLVGEKLGGKDTVAKYLPLLLKKKKIKARVATIRFSDILTETLELWGIPKTRENYSKLSPAFVNTYGPATLADAVRRRAENTEADVILLNGVRWWADYIMMQSLKKAGSKSFLVYVTAPVRMRFERSRTRNEKVGEARTPFVQFVRHERARTEIDIPKIGKKADITIYNTGSMQDLEDAVEKHVLPRLIR